MCQVCTENEIKFKKMMGEEINCWMWNYHDSLQYVAHLVTSGQVVLNKYTDTKRVAEDFKTEKHAEEDIYSLLDLFLALTKPEAELDFDSYGIDRDSLREHDLIPLDIVEIFEGNPVKVANLLAEAQREFVPVYSRKEAN